jgi:hypothetical protein
MVPAYMASASEQYQAEEAQAGNKDGDQHGDPNQFRGPLLGLIKPFS